MSIHKIAPPWGCSDFSALALFLGAGDDTNTGGRNRYPYEYVVYTDGTYYYAENGTTGELDYGGPNDEGAATGTDAAAVIQAAIDDMVNGQGMFIRSGTYPINTGLTINVGITVTGENRRSTILDRGAGADYCIQVGNDVGLLTHVLLQNFRIDVTNAVGILVRGNTYYSEFRFIRVYGDGTGAGMEFNAVTTWQGYHKIDNPFLWGVRDGINFTGTEPKTGIVIVGGHVRGQGDAVAGGVGLDLGSFTETLRVHGLSIAQFETAVTSAAVTSYANYFFGVRIEDVTNGYVIAGSHHKVFGGTVANHVTAVTDTGTWNYFDQLYNYRTKNSGTATIAAAALNTGAIAHGCNYTPAASDIDVILTNLPTNDIGDVYVTAIGAANFTINCRNVPGVATAIFGWSVNRVV